ncbi:MAG: exonuclease 1 [Amphiamblys sp. WSBS2006]|nr:MAG: exonuclease 1 [Amphiamblys sp. WSBS2006]
MGISGLHSFLAPVLKKVNIREYKGKTLGIDGHAWLHRGLYRCGMELLTNTQTEKHLTYCAEKAKRLLAKGITPVFVFDGENIPLKDNTNEERASQREKNKELFLRMDKNDRRRPFYAAKAVDVSSAMVQELVILLQKAEIRSIVSPYEADAQLAHLEKTKVIDAVITEDSDLILFGCKKVLFKLDDRGMADEFCSRRLYCCAKPDLKNMSHNEFIQMCIMSGCDYLKNIPGLGLKTAYALFKKNGTLDAVRAEVESIPKYKIPENYWEDFRMAEVAFKHYIVYDTAEKCRVHMAQIDDSVLKEMGDVSFLGSLEETEESLPAEFTVLSGVPSEKRIRTEKIIDESPYFKKTDISK